MIKADLRKKYTALRKNFSEEEIRRLSSQIVSNFTENFPVAEGLRIHVFLSSVHLREVQTDSLIQYFFKKKCRVFVPKVAGSEMATVEIFPDSKFRNGPFGIAEPVGGRINRDNYFDNVVVPLLYADHLGNRVGYGKGFYDKFFANINESCVKAGLSFFPPKEPVDDASPLDVKLDYLVLPDDVLSFGNLPSKFTK